MQQLSLQVQPEYGLLNPPPAEDHLHEAFRRILLNHILSMEDDTPLTPNVSRDPTVADSTTSLQQPPPKSEKLPSNTTSRLDPKKRKRGEEGSESSTNPRKVVRTVGGLPSVPLHDSRHYNDWPWHSPLSIYVFFQYFNFLSSLQCNLHSLGTPSCNKC